MKIRTVGDELFHADGRTDRWTDGWTHRTKLIVAVRNFAEETKNGLRKPLQGLGTHTLIYIAAYPRILESS